MSCCCCSSRVIWFYNVENCSWIPFGDIDNEIVEEAFSNKRKEFELDNYLINFDRLIEINKQDSSIERSIKRCIRQPHNIPLCSERFNTPQKLVKSFSGNDKNDHRFTNECHKRYRTKPIDQILEIATEGIIKEGILLGKQIEAEWIAQQLRSIIGELYRGAQLDEETIESYKQSIGLVKTWDAFSSTSKYRFSGMDISSISHYPEEEEVLISYDKICKYRCIIIRYF